MKINGIAAAEETSMKSWRMKKRKQAIALRAVRRA